MSGEDIFVCQCFNRNRIFFSKVFICNFISSNKTILLLIILCFLTVCRHVWSLSVCSLCVFVCVCPSAGEDRPQRFQTGLRCPLRRLEFGNHTGEDDDLSCDRLCVWYWKWFLLHCCNAVSVWTGHGTVPLPEVEQCVRSADAGGEGRPAAAQQLRGETVLPQIHQLRQPVVRHTHSHTTAVTLRSPAFPLSQSLLTQQRGCNNSDSLCDHMMYTTPPAAHSQQLQELKMELMINLILKGFN